jgi:hypothetical protein
LHWDLASRELEPEKLQVAHRYLDQVAQRWDEALGRLKKFVEET